MRWGGLNWTLKFSPEQFPVKFGQIHGICALNQIYSQITWMKGLCTDNIYTYVVFVQSFWSWAHGECCYIMLKSIMYVFIYQHCIPIIGCPTAGGTHGCGLYRKQWNICILFNQYNLISLGCQCHRDIHIYHYHVMTFWSILVVQDMINKKKQLELKKKISHRWFTCCSNRKIPHILLINMC